MIDHLSITRWPNFWDLGSLQSLSILSLCTESFMSLPEDMCSELLNTENSIELSSVRTREPWVSKGHITSFTNICAR